MMLIIPHVEHGVIEILGFLIFCHYYSECFEATLQAADAYFDDLTLVQGTAMSRSSCTDLSDKREYPVISMLGTASAEPTRVRNTTGILMQLR